jgi:hypothetical protein
MLISFTIITPTTGNSRLSKLIESINNQNEHSSFTKKIEHFIIIDGPNFTEKTQAILNDNPALNHERFVIQLPFNTGKERGNYLGHKIYASFGQLVRGDWVLFADDDNWYEPNHINNFIENIYQYNKTNDKTNDKSINKNIEWLYCLRKIENDIHGFVCNDNCESLGYLHNVFYNTNSHLIDTNCFCVRRDIMITCSNIWNLEATNNVRDPDRVFTMKLMMEYHNFVCTKQYTLNYFTGNRDDSVKSELFVKGNEIILNTFGSIPWQKPVLYIAHFDSFHTQMVLNRVYGGNKKPLPSVAYLQWNLNFFDKLSEDFLLLNAYHKPELAPAGSKLLLNFCSPNDLPNKLLNRTDIEKIVYTYESPNIRHTLQWDLAFLLPKFNKILTYWKPMLDISNLVDNRIINLPFIGRFDMSNPNDTNCIIENKNVGKKVCMILENRNFSGKYKINEVELTAMDYLRNLYATELGKRIYCYGSTWKSMESIVNYCPAINRQLDKERVIDLMSDYTFCLIIENCNADGYISEKIYDALTVGCIPLYYGNKNTNLEIPDDCYIDLKSITPSELPKLIDHMDQEFINLFRNNIYKKRMDILNKVSINAYTEIIKSVVLPK